MILMLNTIKILKKSILKLKSVIMLEFQIIKRFLLKDTLQIAQKKFLLISENKNTVPWTYAINDLNGEEIARNFCEKALQKTNEKEFRIAKVYLILH